MRHFKKKTIALCLASVVTVLGSFAADEYTNNLVDLRIISGSGGNVTLNAYTEKPYKQSIILDKAGNNFYHITLPETNSSMKKMPDISKYENIESIEVSTFPKTSYQAGFTRIYVKTVNEPTVAAKTTLYIDSTSPATNTISTKKTKAAKQTSYWDKMDAPQKTTQKPKEQTFADPPAPPHKFQQEHFIPQENNDDEVQKEDFPINYKNVSTENNNERWTMLIAVLLVTMLVFFIYFLSKDKMASVVGEQNQIDLSEEKEKKKKHTSKKIRNTINKLDKKYKTNLQSENINIVTGNYTEVQTFKQEEQEQEPQEKAPEPVVVDLDTLFKEKNKMPETEQNTSEEQEEIHDDLASFLDDFSFDEEISTIKQEEAPFDEELYEKTINNNKIHFSDIDNNNLTALMRNEISDDTIEHISEYAPSLPKKENKEEAALIKLENLLAEYTIKQDISFSKEDVDTIKSLMSVELDKSFINDLRTDSKRVEQMRAELAQREKKPLKTSEIITLNVKDLLPDLSKELAKQGNKRIESNAKPDVIYFSEGYEVSKLSVSNELANISNALKKDNNVFRPSDDLPIAINGYEVNTLSIKDELPDLADVKAHPKKYEEKKTKEKIDEDALLKSIANVKFKPFYENVQNELNQFDNFEIITENENDAITDNSINSDNETPQETSQVIASDNKNNGSDEGKKLIQIIEAQQLERQKKEIEIAEKLKQKEEIQKTPKEEIAQASTSCIIDEKRYNIIKTISCDKNFNCCLAHDNNGYDVLGTLNGTFKVLKHYDFLRTENIQTRVNEKNADGSIQYLVRVSIHKFIINITQNSMEFVMDLC